MQEDFIINGKVVADFSSITKGSRNAERSAVVNVKVDGAQALGRLTSKVSEFDKSMDAANARVLAFGASAAVISGVSIALKAMVSNAISVEAKLADINSLLRLSSGSLGQFSSDLFEVAKDTGQSFDTVAESAKEFSRQGLDVEQTLQRTKDAMILVRLSGLSAADATNTLTASINAFEKAGLTSTQIVNKMATVDANFAVSTKDLAEALSRAGNSVQDAGNSFEEFIALVTAAQERTARGGAVIGNALKSIFNREGRSKTMDELEGLGIAVRDVSGSTLPAITVLTNLATTYDTLSDASKNNVAQLVGGVYQMNILKALLSDLAKSNSTYSKARDIATGSDEAAMRRNEELNMTMDASVKAAQANFTKLTASAGKITFEPVIRNVLGLFNAIGKAGAGDGSGEDIGSKIGNGLLTGLGNILNGPGLVALLGIGLKLTASFAQFSTAAVAGLLGINTESRKMIATQEGVAALLRSNPALMDAMLAPMTTRAQKEEQFLAALGRETVATEALLKIRRDLAAVAIGAGMSQSPLKSGWQGTMQTGPKTKTSKASGHIPIEQVGGAAVAHEVSEAKKAGYSIDPSDVRAMRAKINGRLSTVVYNQREKVIDNFMGTGEPAIIPPNKTIGDLINSAQGHLHFPSGFARMKQLGSGAFGSFIDMGRKFGGSMSIGKKLFHEYGSSPTDIAHEYVASKLTSSIGHEFPLVTGPRVFGTLERSLARRRIGKEIVSDPTAYKFMNERGAKDPRLGHGNDVESELLWATRQYLEKDAFGAFGANDMNSSNWAPNSKLREIWDKIGGRFASDSAGGMSKRNTLPFTDKLNNPRSRRQIMNAIAKKGGRVSILDAGGLTMNASELTSYGMEKEAYALQSFTQGSVAKNSSLNFPSGFVPNQANLKAISRASSFFEEVGLPKSTVDNFKFRRSSNRADMGEYRSDGSINVFYDNIIKQVKKAWANGRYRSGYANQQSAIDSVMGNVILHEGFHGAFAQAPDAARAYFSKKGITLPPNAKEFLERHYGKSSAKQYRGREEEEMMAVHLPRQWGYSSAAKGRITLPFGSAEYNIKGKAASIDHVLSPNEGKGNLGRIYDALFSTFRAKGVKKVSGEFAPNMKAVPRSDSSADKLTAMFPQISRARRAVMSEINVGGQIFRIKGKNYEEDLGMQAYDILKAVNVPGGLEGVKMNSYLAAGQIPMASRGIASGAERRVTLPPSWVSKTLKKKPKTLKEKIAYKAAQAANWALTRGPALGEAAFKMGDAMGLFAGGNMPIIHAAKGPVKKRRYPTGSDKIPTQLPVTTPAMPAAPLPEIPNRPDVRQMLIGSGKNVPFGPIPQAQQTIGEQIQQKALINEQQIANAKAQVEMAAMERKQAAARDAKLRAVPPIPAAPVALPSIPLVRPAPMPAPPVALPSIPLVRPAPMPAPPVALPSIPLVRPANPPVTTSTIPAAPVAPGALRRRLGMGTGYDVNDTKVRVESKLIEPRPPHLPEKPRRERLSKSRMTPDVLLTPTGESVQKEAGQQARSSNLVRDRARNVRTAMAAVDATAKAVQDIADDKVKEAKAAKKAKIDARNAKAGNIAMMAAFALPMAGGMASSFVNQESAAGQIKAQGINQIATGLGTGIMMGSMIGSVVPGVGTAIGAGVGAVIGGGIGTYQAVTASNRGETATMANDRLLKAKEGRMTQLRGMGQSTDIMGQIEAATQSGDAQSVSRLYGSLQTSMDTIKDPSVRAQVLATTDEKGRAEMLTKATKKEQETEARDNAEVGIKAFRDKYGKKVSGYDRDSLEGKASLKGIAQNIVASGRSAKDFDREISSQFGEGANTEELRAALSELVTSLQASKARTDALAQSQQKLAEQTINFNKVIGQMNSTASMKRSFASEESSNKYNLEKVESSRATQLYAPFMSESAKAEIQYNTESANITQETNTKYDAIAENTRATLSGVFANSKTQAGKELGVKVSTASNEELMSLTKDAMGIAGGKEGKKEDLDALVKIHEQLKLIGITEKGQLDIAKRNFDYNRAEIQQKIQAQSIGDYNTGAFGGAMGALVAKQQDAAKNRPVTVRRQDGQDHTSSPAFENRQEAMRKGAVALASYDLKQKEAGENKDIAFNEMNKQRAATGIFSDPRYEGQRKDAEATAARVAFAETQKRKGAALGGIADVMIGTDNKSGALGSSAVGLFTAEQNEAIRAGAINPTGQAKSGKLNITESIETISGAYKMLSDSKGRPGYDGPERQDQLESLYQMLQMFAAAKDTIGNERQGAINAGAAAFPRTGTTTTTGASTPAAMKSAYLETVALTNREGFEGMIAASAEIVEAIIATSRAQAELQNVAFAQGDQIEAGKKYATAAAANEAARGDVTMAEDEEGKALKLVGQASVKKDGTYEKAEEIYNAAVAKREEAEKKLKETEKPMNEAFRNKSIADGAATRAKETYDTASKTGREIAQNKDAKAADASLVKLQAMTIDPYKNKTTPESAIKEFEERTKQTRKYEQDALLSGGEIDQSEQTKIDEMAAANRKIAENIEKLIKAKGFLAEVDQKTSKVDMAGNFTIKIGDSVIVAKSKDEIGEAVKTWVDERIKEMIAAEKGRTPTVPTNTVNP